MAHVQEYADRGTRWCSVRSRRSWNNRIYRARPWNAESGSVKHSSADGLGREIGSAGHGRLARCEPLTPRAISTEPPSMLGVKYKPEATSESPPPVPIGKTLGKAHPFGQSGDFPGRENRNQVPVNWGLGLKRIIAVRGKTHDKDFAATITPPATDRSRRRPTISRTHIGQRIEDFWTCAADAEQMRRGEPFGRLIRRIRR